jgi:hypothetical protein
MQLPDPVDKNFLGLEGREELEGKYVCAPSVYFAESERKENFYLVLENYKTPSFARILT